MKTKVILLLFVCLMLTGCVNNKLESILVNGIENFVPENSGEETYLLYYPSDVRVSQKETFVKEINLKGETIKKYKINDDYFRRMKIHQKPNELNKLYISLFGETKIDNYFYTYNIIDRKFEKIDLDYFNYEVGVDHIMHYGEDVLFQTITSHKTGTQNYKEDTMQFNMSISNYSKKLSFETEYGSPPSWAALLGFNNRILYGASGQYDDNDKLITSGLGIINLEDQSIKYSLPMDSDEIRPIYCSDEFAFVMNNLGEIFVYDRDFQYKTHDIFGKTGKGNLIFHQENQPLLLNEDKALYILYSATEAPSMGSLVFKEVPEFTIVKVDYMESNNQYKILYQDLQEKEIYIVKSNDRNSSLLVIDNENFNLLHEIPIEYSHLLDFVVKGRNLKEQRLIYIEN